MSRRHRTAATTALLALLLTPALLWADEPGDKGDPTVVILGDDGERVSIEMDGTALTIVTEDDGETSVRMVDVGQVGKLVEGSMGEVMAALQDMQLDVHMGHDNHLEFSHGEATVAVDVDAILAQVGAALEAGFAEFEAEDWTRVHARDRGDEDLREELRELKRELRDLKRELRRQER